MSRDLQAKSHNTSRGVPILSPLLHWLAMPVLVILRRGFGYAYLSSKFIFLITIFTASIFSYIILNDPDYRPLHGSMAVFSIVTSILYLSHLAISFASEARSCAEHDQFSGISNLLSFVSDEQRRKLEPSMHRILEPALVVACGFLFSGVLGSFLQVAGGALLSKEWINAWIQVRERKILRDSIQTTEHRMLDAAGKSRPTPNTGGRTDERRVPRHHGSNQATSD
jgi:hypothetical protein